MTNDTTAPEEQPEDAPSWPERVSLDWLRQVIADAEERHRFEDWAHHFWLCATCNYHATRLELRKLERAGIAPDTLLAERVRLDCAKPQLEEFAFLAAANPENDALEVSDPLTAKYLCLWLWATNGGYALHGEHRDTSLPLDWATILEPELLAAFHCEA